MRSLLIGLLPLALSACGLSGTDRYEDENEAADRATNSTTENLADSMASNDDGTQARDPELQIDDPEARPIMQLQVVLDREGFGPGVIDGRLGMSTENALEGFQEAQGIAVTGEHDAATREALTRWKNIPATRVVRVPAEWGRLSYVEIPEDPAQQAEMERLGYTSLDEKLAERFHTTLDVLKSLNPGGRPAGMDGSSANEARRPTSAEDTSSSSPDQAQPGEGASDAAFFTAGQLIRVPNIGADRIAPGAISDEGWEETLQSLGVGTEQPEVARIVVSEEAKTLKAYDASDKLVALFTVTTGSRNDPLPLGEWGINGVGHNPRFSYNPELFWDVPDEEEKQQLPPGPNGPVGVVWIDLTKEHYGIHGTSEPQTIGRVQSHGCVRLTNWDAARLAQMVSNSTQVIFEA